MTKHTFFAVTILLLAQVGPAASCELADFKVEKFRFTVHDDCQASPCPAYDMTGKLRNNCSEAAGAQIQIVALNKAGEVVDEFSGWPASIHNIAPGAARAFNFGSTIEWRKEISDVTVEITDVRTW
jgi:hypothetical protein